MRARGSAIGAALAAGAVAVAGAGCGGGGDDEGPASGSDVFADAGCGDCHTLTAADASGVTGSNLDETKLDATQIAEFVRDGVEGMPPYSGRLSEEEITAVSGFVAESAEDAPG